MSLPRYVLSIPAHNEERQIERTLASVAAQSLPPLLCAVVDDASTDRTGEIARAWCERCAWMRVVRREPSEMTGNARRTSAIAAGHEAARDLAYDYFGVLDADVVLPPDYYATLLGRLEDDPGLGVAGGWIVEDVGDGPLPRFTNAEFNVPGALQTFRRTAYDAVGGYCQLPYGGIDTVIQAQLRRAGWRCRAYPDLPVLHLRPTGVRQGSNVLHSRFRDGLRARSQGNHPLFQVLKAVRRLAEPPVVLGSLAVLAGYLYGLLRHRCVLEPDLAAYIRREQMQRVRGTLRGRTRPH